MILLMFMVHDSTDVHGDVHGIIMFIIFAFDKFCKNVYL